MTVSTTVSTTVIKTLKRRIISIRREAEYRDLGGLVSQVKELGYLIEALEKEVQNERV